MSCTKKERIEALRKLAKHSSDGVTVVADSKLYTEENIRALGSMHFISRVPASTKQENVCIDAAFVKIGRAHV